MNWKELHACLLLNPAAGASRSRKKQQAKWIRTLTSHIGRLEVLVPQDPQYLHNLVRRAIERDCDVIIAGGGDGTLHQVVQSFAASADLSLPLLAQVPFGSGNDFLRQYDFHRLTDSNLKRFLRSQPSPIDLGHCNGTWFINGVGFALAADVGKTFQELGHSGPLGYLLASLKCAGKYKPLQCQITTDEVTEKAFLSILVVGNGPFSGGGFRLTPTSRPGDGHMELCFVQKGSAIKLLSCIPSAKRGSHINKSFVYTKTFKHLSLQFPEPVIAQLDGEILPPSSSWEISVHPSKIRFLIPQD